MKVKMVAVVMLRPREMDSRRKSEDKLSKKDKFWIAFAIAVFLIAFALMLIYGMDFLSFLV